MKKSKIIAAIVAAVLGIFSFSLIPASVDAASVCSQDVPQEIKDANGCGGGSSTELSSVIVYILDGIIGVLSLVAVIFIIVGGVNYMSSNGDPGKIQKAKNTILYAVIGLIIGILSFVIVNFVVNNLLNGEGGESGESGETTTVETNTENTNGGGGNSGLNGGGPATN